MTLARSFTAAAGDALTSVRLGYIEITGFYRERRFTFIYMFERPMESVYRADVMPLRRGRGFKPFAPNAIQLTTTEMPNPERVGRFAL